MNEDALQTLLDDLSFIDQWEDRYRYVIELGQQLPDLDPQECIDANKVQGCVSQVWLVSDIVDTPQGREVHFKGQSDAHIVQGLIAIALKLFSGVKAEALAEADLFATMARLGLSDHLTAQRSNGLKALLNKMQAIARDAQ